MLKIGLTGGIGSGKSMVAGIFQVMGVPVFNADNEAKRLMQTDAELVVSIKKLLGEEAYINGVLNRPYISSIVFNDSYKLTALNNLVHPVVIKANHEWMKSQTAPYVIKEAALLFESGSVENLDLVIGVSSPEILRIKRVMQRDNITKEQVVARIDKQIDTGLKMKLCDYIITNDEQTSLIKQVEQLLIVFENKRLAS